MILVDTSVWADHFRQADNRLSGLLVDARVVMHPFVTGELALGNLRDWEATVAILRGLPRAAVATEADLLALVALHGLVGTGIGFVDAHLLAATRLMPGLQLWTRDKRLDAKAGALGVRWPLS